MVTETDNATTAHEGRFHSYVGRRIPWYVHLGWIVFWSFALYYIVMYLLPALQHEIVSPSP